MIIYFVRHGETDWNKEKKFLGHSDIPLNEKGISQANKLMQYFKDKNIDKIFSSDLKRAYETGKIISSFHNLSPVRDKRLREINFGFWEGLDFNAIYENYREDFDAWYNDSINTCIPGGESVKEVSLNLVNFLNELNLYENNNIIVTTHGGFIKTLLWYINKNNNIFWEQKLSHGSITAVEISKNIKDMKILSINLQPQNSL
jgi:alpha-ribazole phosphatase